MAPQARYLTGNKEDIKEFIDKFDVSQIVISMLWALCQRSVQNAIPNMLTKASGIPF